MLSKKSKMFLSLVLSGLMAYMPAFASANGGMITTNVVLADLDQQQTQQKVENLLSRQDVQQALRDQGISPDEVNARLASLSPQEMKQFSMQLEQARAGGDILVAILLVVLIIFLIKRI